MEFNHIENYLKENYNEELIEIIIWCKNYDFKSKNPYGNTLLHFAASQQYDNLPSLIKVSDVN